MPKIKTIYDSKKLITGLLGSEKSTSKEIFKKIDKLLEQKKPVLISYDADILKEENPSTKLNIMSFHASLIIGKKLENGKKVYIIRNSWGDTIFSYIENATKIDNCYSNYKKTQEEKEYEIKRWLKFCKEQNKKNKDSWIYEPFDLEEEEKKLKKEIKVIESKEKRREKIKQCINKFKLKSKYKGVTSTLPSEKFNEYIYKDKQKTA